MITDPPSSPREADRPGTSPEDAPGQDTPPRTAPSSPVGHAVAVAQAPGALQLAPPLASPPRRSLTSLGFASPMRN
eukprot:10604594-Alexandrium_andersonii.AAC.1